MAAGPKPRARANYITARMESLLPDRKQSVSTFNSVRLHRPVTAKLQKHQQQLPETKLDPVINYCRLTTGKQQTASRSTNRYGSLPIVSTSNGETSEYSDDWESDYSDDWESDTDDESSPANIFQKRQSETKACSDSKRKIPIDGNAFGKKFCSRRQAAIENTSYRTAVDAWKAKSLHEVVDLIHRLSAGKSVIDRAWIVFYWVSQNIEYDVEAYFSGRIPCQTSENVFKNRKGVCDAFGTIFETLCTGVQIECKKISGYAKGYSFQLGETSFKQSNHAWNVIRLEGHWYLIDSTWGTGHLDHKNKNKKELDPYYFLVRPERMIYSHFPDDARWQLLASPSTMHDFFNLPLVSPTYFKLDLDIVSPSDSSMASFNSNSGLAEVHVRAPYHTDFSTSIELMGSEKNPVGSFVQFDADQKLWQCLFAPHTEGMHRLTIFANRKKASVETENSQTTTYSCAIQLGLQVPTGFRGTRTFPTTYSLFTECRCQIFEPLNTALKPGSTMTIHCRIPNAHCVRLLLDDLWLPEDLVKDDIFKRQLVVPHRTILLYVKFSDKKNTSSYDGLFKYVLK